VGLWFRRRSGLRFAAVGVYLVGRDRAGVGGGVAARELIKCGFRATEHEVA
jgi:hypothetical protein